MAAIQPDLQWYTEISAAKNLSPRCPFASADRCPRYYESLSLLGKVGVSTSIPSDKDQRLEENWRRSDLWPVTMEQSALVMPRLDGEPSQYLNFCPEVAFDRFGWFASHLSRHSDPIDVDVAISNLEVEGASPDDWRRTWSLVKPLHYAECRLYSLLLIGGNDATGKAPIGFSS